MIETGSADVAGVVSEMVWDGGIVAGGGGGSAPIQQATAPLLAPAPIPLPPLPMCGI
jgi:hypothetical protein